MALITAPTNYTDKDLASIRTRLYALVASVFPEWTDDNIATFGNVLIECFAFVGDILTFYQDKQAAESRITTATQRRSLIALCKLIGFAPPGATASQADVVFALAAVAAGDVVLPAGTEVATSDVTSPVTFQLLLPLTIPASATTATGTVENSLAAEDLFTSSGLPNQEFTLSATPYLDDSAFVTAADGTYSQVDNFLNSLGSNKVYTMVVDQNDRARLRFGNGVSGAVPAGTITTTYKTGGGSAGGVAAGTIRVLSGSFTDTLGNPVQITVNNPAKATTGLDRMANDAIKARAPASVRAPINSVSREDFEINALRLGAVARALMLTSNEDAGVPENSGNLYIVPVGGGVPPNALLAQVQTQVTTTYPCPLTFLVNALQPLYATVNVAARVYRGAGYSTTTVRSNITDTLTAWFAVQNADGSPNTKVDFGANYLDSTGMPDPNLPWSDLFDALRNTKGVRKIAATSDGFLLNGLRADVPLLSPQFPILGSITLIDGDTGASF